MKLKKLKIYLLSMVIPVIIFLACATIIGFLPFNEELLNSYDSFTQYPGFLLEFIRLLKKGNIFYSFNGALGFNFFSTMTYYTMSPLNLLAIFATPQNYPYFIAVMTLIRFSLMSLSMCFYLDNKKIKPLNIIIFSTIYTLMGYSSTYYYNYIWIDSLIMLPLVIHGLDRILDNKSPTFYIFTLTLTIIINYYIGYMICIFCLIWFIHKIINIKERKKITKTFLMSSILSGIMCMFIIIPSAYALLEGKADLYKDINYFSFSSNALFIPYFLSTGSYSNGDQINGPALIYSGILVLVLSIFYFYNRSFSKKEKISSSLIILFFILSFGINLLNYAWQLFQRPIWWQSRFSFLFSFFLITLSANTLNNIEKTNFNVKKRVIISVIFSVSIILSAFLKFNQTSNVEIYKYFYLAFSIIIFLEFIFLLDKKAILPMIMLFSFIDITINTFNSLKSNYNYSSVNNYLYLKKELPDKLKMLDEHNPYFYRFELMNSYTSNDGLYFGYNGINYFNSIRNNKVMKTLDKLGIEVIGDNHVEIKNFDPFIMSLLGIKYIYANDLDYFKKIDNRIYENPYPLGLGFLSKSSITNVKLTDDIYDNKKKIINNILGEKIELYKKVTYEDFKREKAKNIEYFQYEFVSTYDSILLFEDYDLSVLINGQEVEILNNFLLINSNDLVNLTYEIVSDYDPSDIFFNILDLDVYEDSMKKISKNIFKAKVENKDCIVEGTVDVEDDESYLFTSIGYEKGIKLYIDEKETKPDIILDSLIGINLKKGLHTIKITYIPNGLIEGIIISTVGLVLTVLYLQTKKKKL